jgi:hypothetical protein
MMRSDLPSSGSPSSPNGAAASGTSTTGRLPPFHSILSERADDAAQEREQPDFFVDLNLDQVLATICVGREQHRLEAFFYAPLRTVAAVHYRQSVLRDLEKPGILEPITHFAHAMQRMRDQREQAETLRYPLQHQAWFLAAVATYCEAVSALTAALSDSDARSQGVQALSRYLTTYTSSERFTALVAQTSALKRALGELRYAIHISGPRVTVSGYEGEADYTTEIEETFARFRQGAVRSYLTQSRNPGGMNHVEEQILDRVARLHLDTFTALASFCERHRDYLDATIGQFDREVHFYLGYLELVARLRAAGLSLCYPHVSARNKHTVVEEAFDLALAAKLTTEGAPVICNDLQLDGPERIFVISGPNNGGKTTFARMFGQLHYLASLGLLVPGRQADLFLPDRIYTHFEREENLDTLRGKLEDELVRVHDILEHATSNSVIVMNESFNSTTLDDALFLGTEVMRRILDLDALGVYVTFVEELADLSDATISVVSTIVPDNPAVRTFKLVRRPADGVAYAWAIAEKYGLTYQRLIERIK